MQNLVLQLTIRSYIHEYPAKNDTEHLFIQKLDTDGLLCDVCLLFKYPSYFLLLDIPFFITLKLCYVQLL